MYGVERLHEEPELGKIRNSKMPISLRTESDDVCFVSIGDQVRLRR
jgi:hypothetical protein